MDRYSRYRDSSSEAGRVSLVLALAVAILVCGGLSYYFLQVGPSPETADEVSGGPEPWNTVSERDASSERPDVAPEAGAAVGETAPSSGPTIATTPAAKPANRRLFGLVQDTDGRPLPQLHVRWVPASKKDLRMYSHDERALGKDADPMRLPEGPLRDALARSQVSSTAEDGRYELRPPLAEQLGVVVVAGPGYEMETRGVEEQPAVRSVAEVPEKDATLVEAESTNDVEINFQLRAAGSISGEVTDKNTGDVPSGVAVVAGVIDADSPAMMSFVDKDAPSTVIGDDGSYLLAGLPPGEYRVLPRTGDSDYVSFSTRQGTKVVLEPGLDVTDVDFKVTRGVRVFGRVTASGDKAISGAKCAVVPTDIMALAMRRDMDALMILDRKNRSDANGYYEVRGVPPGKAYWLSVEAEGYAVGTSEAVQLKEDELEVEVNLTLTVGSAIAGRVLLADGSPAPSTPVHVVPNVGEMVTGNIGSAGKRLKTVTDESGAFRLEHLVAGEYKLNPGELKPQEMFTGQQTGKSVSVDGTNDVTGIELILVKESAGMIAGVVVDDQGTPVEGVSIRVSKPQDFMGMSASKASTDANGRFTASGLTGAVFQVAASKQGYSNAKLSEIAIDNTAVEITLNRHGSVSGRVITIEGVAPATGGTVKAQPVGGRSLSEDIMIRGGRQRNSDAAVNPDGSFSVEAPAGTIQIQATVPGFAPASSGSITLSPGEEHSGVEILVTSGAVISGRVTLGGNQPIEGASITARSVKEGEAEILLMPQMNQAVTDDTGRFEVPYLAPGKYSVTAAHAAYAPSDAATVSVARDEMREIPDLALSLGGVVAGRVLDVDKPKAGIMVQLIGGGPLKQATSLADGSFKFEGVKAGDYMLNIVDIIAMQRGRMVLKTDSVSVENEQTTEIDVVFGIGKRIYGKVTGGMSGPLRMITLRRPGGPAPEELDPTVVLSLVKASRYQAGVAMVKPDGFYEIVDIEPGEYIIEIPRMLIDSTDMAAFKKMDRTPHYRKEITVEKEDLEHDIVIK